MQGNTDRHLYNEKQNPERQIQTSTLSLESRISTELYADIQTASHGFPENAPHAQEKISPRTPPINPVNPDYNARPEVRGKKKHVKSRHTNNCDETTPQRHTCICKHPYPVQT